MAVARKAIGDTTRLFVDANGAYFIDQKSIPNEELLPDLQASSENDKERRIHVRADRNVNYGKVMEVMGLLSQAGFTHIGLVTDAIKPKPDAQ